MSRRGAALVGLMMAAASCEAEEPAYEGETHWLGACATEGDCTYGVCLCGVCTTECDGDRDCDVGGPDALCYDAASPGLTAQCADAIARAVCLASCEGDGDCPPGTACHLGACTAPSPEPAPVQASDYLGEGGEPFDFSEPVWLPEPSGTISGDAAALEGAWWAIGRDGETWCSEDNPMGNSGHGLLCAALEVRATPTGGFEAFVSWTSEGPGPDPTGPFAPILDASAGYPAEFNDVRDVRDWWGFLANVPYRLYDARFDGATLTGWYSFFDLWSDWCALQPSIAVVIDGTPAYRCDDPFAEPTDEVHWALCTSKLDWGLCDYDAFSVPVPCACEPEEDPRYDTDCTYAACECDSTRCRAALRNLGPRVFELVDGELHTATGGDPWASPHDGQLPARFRRRTGNDGT